MANTSHKILFIEDDDFLRSLVVTKLQKDGFTIATMSDGRGAMEKIEAEQPDVVLLDLMLPTISGFEVLEQIRASVDWKTLKVVIFSNLGGEEDIKKGQELGADEFLIKANFTLDELSEKIKAILE